MKRTAVAFLVLLLIALTASVACGGDDGAEDGPATATPAPGQNGDSVATEEDTAYFDALARTLADLAAESAALSELRATAFDASLTEEQKAANAEEFAERYAEFGRNGRETLLEIDPAGTLSGQHGRLVDAMGGLAELGEQLGEAMSETPVATEEEFRELFFELNGQNVELRVRDACFDLQSFATRHNVEVELICPR